MRFFINPLAWFPCELLKENSDGTSGLPLITPVHQPAVYVDGWHARPHCSGTPVRRRAGERHTTFLLASVTRDPKIPLAWGDP